nr:hypothetical protein GCM10020092_026170 [Actinoplanes digitatis]
MHPVQVVLARAQAGLLGELAQGGTVECLVAHEAAGQGTPSGERVAAALDEQDVQPGVPDGQRHDVDGDGDRGVCTRVVALEELPFVRHRRPALFSM